MEKRKKEKEKKTQLGLVERVVGRRRIGWETNNLAGVFAKRRRHGQSSLFCVLGRRYICDRKNGKGSGREGSGTGSEGSERVRTRTSSMVGPSGTPSRATN